MLIGFPLAMMGSSYIDDNALINIANHVNIPGSINIITDTNYVRINETFHTAGPGGYTNIQSVWSNGQFGLDGEYQGGYDFTIKSAILYNGTWYPQTFDGNAE